MAIRKYYRFFILIIALSFVLTSCDKKKKLPIDLLRQTPTPTVASEEVRSTEQKRERESLEKVEITSYEDGYLYWEEAFGGCDEGPIRYFIFVSAQEDPGSDDFIGREIEVEGKTEFKLDLNFRNSRTLFIFIIAVDACGNESGLSDPYRIDRSDIQSKEPEMTDDSRGNTRKDMRDTSKVNAGSSKDRKISGNVSEMLSKRAEGKKIVSTKA
jgi:hypothetical protein